MVGGRRDPGDSEEGSEAKGKATPTKLRAGGGDHRKEAGLSKRQREEELGEQEDEADDDSDDGELLIADNEAQYDEDRETEEDSDVSDDPEDGQNFTGTMTRRQSKQLKEAGDSPSGSAKKRNRTCEYCGVIKATPAALVRHIRKHTGERPFVCKLCGKAYKAKRSLNLHENTQHNGIGKNPLPTQVPQESATNFSIADHIQKQTLQASATTPPISESTKSLLRETLESSRKAKDVTGTAATTTTTTVTVSSDDMAAIDTSVSVGGARPSERLSTPNLVNLLTSDISAKMEQGAAAATAAAAAIANSSSAVPVAVGSVKLELDNGMLKMEAEEQAQDLSMKKRKKEDDLHSSKELFTCEFCSETFRHETAKAVHIQTVHGIIVSFFHPPPTRSAAEDAEKPHNLSATTGNHHAGKATKHIPLATAPAPLPAPPLSNKSSFTKIEPKPTTAGLLNLPQFPIPKHHHHHLATSALPDMRGQELTPQPSYSSLLTKKIRESHQSVSPSSQDTTPNKSGNDTPSAVVMPTGDVPHGQDETNALPYYITSRMMIDFSGEELAAQELTKTVLAEDGGHRKCRITVTKETVLVTRLDGINNITGRQATVYKCQLCKRIFSSLMRYNNHMPSHLDTEITTYDCRYCDASFRSHLQIIKHLQCHREKFVGFNNPVLEDVHHQKKKSEFDVMGSAANTNSGIIIGNNSSTVGTINLSSSVSPVGGKNSDSPSPQPILEPGERVNGGYPCGKCRKSFSREYLLQRHMRIHQNQSSFYCPDCESGFTGELDLMEHRKCYHGLKASEEQQKYLSLLSSNQNKTSHNHIKHGKHLSDTNNNSNINSLVTAAALSAPSKSTAGAAAGGVGVNPAFDVNRRSGGMYPMVDMKAIDLRHGEEVAVRMMEGVEDSKSKEALLKKAQQQAEEYNKQMMLKAFLAMLAERQQQQQSGGQEAAGGGPSWQAALRAEQMKQMLMNTFSNEEELRKRMMAEKAGEEMRRAALLKKRQEEHQQQQQQQQARMQKKEDEKRRRLEQAQLKEKLAKEGMGDVTVVLPVAPSPDVSVSGKERGVVVNSASEDLLLQPSSLALTGKVAGENVTNRQDAVSHLSTSSSSRITNVLEKEYGHGPSSVNDIGSSRELKAGGDNAGENAAESSVDLSSSGNGGLRRSLSSADAAGAPPSKSRRKALKPQKINHFTAEESSDSKKGTESHSDVTSGMKEEEKATQSQKTGQSQSAKNLSDKAKTEPSSDAFLTYNGLQHLLAFRNSAIDPSSDLSVVNAVSNKGFTTYGKSGASVGVPSALQSRFYDNKIIAGYDALGQPIMFNSNGANNSGDDEADSSGAMDLTTESAKKKKKKKTSTAVSIPLGNHKSTSPHSSSSSSPSPAIVTAMSYDVNQLQGSSSSTASHGNIHKPKPLSRSASMEHELSSQDYINYGSPDADSSKLGDEQQQQQLNFKLALTQSQFSKALLANSASTPTSGALPCSMGQETAGLIGLPRVVWGTSSVAGGKSCKSLLAASAGALSVGVGVGLKVSTNGVTVNKNRPSSPSPAPSPTNSDTSSDGRKITSLSRTHSSARATSLSRTHSRLSVVNEPVDRNALCKPKVIENGKAVYSCAICSKNFLSLSDINRHMDFHEDIRPYKCKYCDYYARTNSQLKVHKLRHEGVREFCCRVCNYRGVTQSDLNRHMKSQVHLLRSNHVCGHCGEGFVTPKTLKEHMTKSCNGTRLDCFDKSFEHEGKTVDEMDLGDLDDGFDKEEEEEEEEEEGISEEEMGGMEDEGEVMDMRIVGIDEASGTCSKEMKVMTA